jgi:serine/threonine protein kinase
LLPGTVVGEYRIKRRIADGGMATVYAGIHPLIHKKVAIKVMRPVDHGTHDAVDRFIREARTVNQISHPNIVEVFACGELPDGRCYLVMDWLAGETLAARLRKGRLPFEEALDILLQIVEALAAAHDKEIIHRDIKPENIHLVPAGKKRVAAKLLDFGISTLLVDDAAPDATGQRHFIGTPKYTSPEQAGGVVGDRRSDIYSLGVTAFELFVGRVPFEGQQASDLLRLHLTEIPPAPSTFWPAIPLQLERLLAQMLEKNPERRPLLGEVVARLAELRTALGKPGLDEDPTEMDGLPRRKSRAGVAVTVGVAAALGAVGVAAWRLHQDVHRALPEVAQNVEVAAPTPTAPSAIPPPSTPEHSADAPATTDEQLQQAARLQVDVDVRSVIKVDGHVVARGRRAALDVTPGTAHLLVVSAPPRAAYHERVIVKSGSTVELAVRLGASRPSAHRRPSHSAPSKPAPEPQSGDPDYTLNPFRSR